MVLSPHARAGPGQAKGTREAPGRQERIQVAKHRKESGIVSLTGALGVGDGDPEVDRLLRAELLVVPLPLDAHVAVRLDGDPRVVVADLEALLLARLVQREHELPFRRAVRLGELDPLGRAQRPRRPSLHDPVLRGRRLPRPVLFRVVVHRADDDPRRMLRFPEGRAPVFHRRLERVRLVDLARLDDVHVRRGQNDLAGLRDHHEPVARREQLEHQAVVVGVRRLNSPDPVEAGRVPVQLEVELGLREDRSVVVRVVDVDEQAAGRRAGRARALRPHYQVVAVHLLSVERVLRDDAGRDGAVPHDAVRLDAKILGPVTDDVELDLAVGGVVGDDGNGVRDQSAGRLVLENERLHGRLDEADHAVPVDDVQLNGVRRLLRGALLRQVERQRLRLRREAVQLGGRHEEPVVDDGEPLGEGRAQQLVLDVVGMRRPPVDREAGRHVVSDDQTPRRVFGAGFAMNSAVAGVLLVVLARGARQHQKQEAHSPIGGAGGGHFPPVTRRAAVLIGRRGSKRSLAHSHRDRRQRLFPPSLSFTLNPSLALSESLSTIHDRRARSPSWRPSIRPSIIC